MRSVLVVEDDPTMSELIADLLVDEGYRVLQTGSAAVGLRLARQYRPEAVVLDIMLGQRSGLDVLRELKDAEPTRDIRVVAISGNADLLQDHAVRQALPPDPARADAADVDTPLAERLSQRGQGTGLVLQTHGELLRHRLARTI